MTAHANNKEAKTPSTTSNVAMLVTPAKAEEWISKAEQNGDHNRKSSAAHIAVLAKAMKSGQWKFTHQGIAFSKTGRFLDGWHRCKACILADTPFWTHVTFGLDDTAMEGIDLAARVRNTANLLEMSGEVSSVQLSTVLGFLFQYSNGTMGSNIQGGGKGTSGASYERAAMLKKYPKVRESVKFVSGSDTLRRAFAANAALHAIATVNGHQEEVEVFLAQAASGLGMKAHTGVYEWNKKLTVGSKHHLWGRSQYRLALAIKCFNAFLEDRPLRNLAWKETEAFPTMQKDKMYLSVGVDPALLQLVPQKQTASP